jgi:hypothetical protein
MILRSPREDENAEFVMPAWFAGIQVRKDAAGDVQIHLDSSAPCWNDAIEGFGLTDRVSSRGYFLRRSRRARRVRIYLIFNFVSFVVKSRFD